MKRQTGYTAFPTAFLTFSLLLLVLAAGFAVGRLIVGRIYVKAAGQFEKWPAAKPDSPEQPPEYEPPRGQVHVPERSERLAEPATEAASLEPVGPTEIEPQMLPSEADESPSAPEPPQTARPVPPTPPAGESRETRYAIQVGMFLAEQGARQMADELARAGYPARVEVTRGDEGTTYRVLTGRYRTEYAARKAMDQLRQEGLQGFLVKR